jgi:CBS domain-containing protein
LLATGGSALHPDGNRTRGGGAVKIAEILKSKGSNVVTIHPDQSLASAAKSLTTRGIGALVVSSDGRSIEGILSERDVVRAVADDGTALGRPVREAMTAAVVTCAPSDTVTRAMGLMTQRRHRHLPVVADGALIGLVSIGDLVKARLEDLQLESQVLREVYVASH